MQRTPVVTDVAGDHDSKTKRAPAATSVHHIVRASSRTRTQHRGTRTRTRTRRDLV